VINVKKFYCWESNLGHSVESAVNFYHKLLDIQGVPIKRSDHQIFVIFFIIIFVIFDFLCDFFIFLVILLFFVIFF